jgi:F-box/TPR repeat protein Pof3
MSKIDLALKDAKAMIRADRTDGRGYLRCGQIERLQEHKLAAVDYYKHGLKNVPVSDRHYQPIVQALSTVEDQMRIETTMSKATDPMTVLPLEVVETILSFLNYRQHVRMLRVSKPWNQLLSHMRPLTDTLAFPDASRDITPKMLHAAQRRLKVPRVVNISRLSKAAAPILADTLARWQSFSTLEYLGVNDRLMSPWKLPLAKYNLKSIITGSSTVIPIGSVIAILHECSGLEIAQFHQVHNDCSNHFTMKYANAVLEGESLQQLELHMRGYVTVDRVSADPL